MQLKRMMSASQPSVQPESSDDEPLVYAPMPTHFSAMRSVLEAPSVIFPISVGWGTRVRNLLNRALISSAPALVPSSTMPCQAERTVAPSYVHSSFGKRCPEYLALSP